jgi:hypothetical protein
MKCPDCQAEMLTYSQHLRAGCAKHAERTLFGRDLPARTIAGSPRVDKRTVKAHVPRRNAGAERIVKEGVPGKPGRPRTRPAGARQGRNPDAPCSLCKNAQRVSGDTYCQSCRKTKNAEAKRRQRENNRAYQSTRNGSAPAIRRIKSQDE